MTQTEADWQPVYSTAVQCAAWVDDPGAQYGWRECKNRTTRPSGMCRVHEEQGQEFPA
jgi:hypothetical protein